MKCSKGRFSPVQNLLHRTVAFAGSSDFRMENIVQESHSTEWPKLRFNIARQLALWVPVEEIPETMPE